MLVVRWVRPTLVSPIKRTVRTSLASTRLKDAEHTALVANAGGRLTQARRRIALAKIPLRVRLRPSSRRLNGHEVRFSPLGVLEGLKRGEQHLLFVVCHLIKNADRSLDCLRGLAPPSIENCDCRSNPSSGGRVVVIHHRFQGLDSVGGVLFGGDSDVCDCRFGFELRRF
jgi:hypothetical protein